MVQSQNPRREIGWSDIRPRHIVTIGFLAMLVGILYAARDVLGPYILGVTFAYLLLPLVRRVEQWIPATGRLATVRRPLSALITLAITSVCLVLILVYVARPVVDDVQQLADDFSEYWTSFMARSDVEEWTTDNLPPEAQTWLDENVGDLGSAVVSAATNVLGYFLNATQSIVQAVAAFVIVPIFMIYVLIERPRTKYWIRRLLPVRWQDDAIASLTLSDSIFAAYTRGVILSSAVVGLITALGYWLVGIELWVALGAIAFFGEIVPILGPWIAFAVSFPVVLVTQPDKALLAVLVFGLIQALEGWFISPKIQGNSIAFPAPMVLISLALGGAIAGPLGIVLALPAFAILRAAIVYTLARLDGFAPEVAAVSASHATFESRTPATEAESLAIDATVEE